MDEMSKSIEKKSFFAIAAYAAESMTDQLMIDNIVKVIKKYEDAKTAGATKSQLKIIFTEMSILSYINVVRMIDRKASDVITDMKDVEKVLQLIKPNTN